MKKREITHPTDIQNIPILYEDTSMVIIDKPCGMVVNRAESIKVKTIQDWMEDNYLSAEKQASFKKDDDSFVEFISRSGVVHRLDKETSGVLVLSKMPEAFQFLKNQFKAREVTKKYTALVHGAVEPPAAAINAPVGRLPWNRLRFGVFTGGREARTEYRSEMQYKSPAGEPLTLLTVTPHTGRTHQIRVHVQYIHHPIVGDLLYGGRKTARDDRQWCPRLFLHARELTLTSPETGKQFTIVSPLPQELANVLNKLPAYAT